MLYIFRDVVAYTTSKATTEVTLNGNYTVTEKVYNKMLKVISEDTGKFYWIKEITPDMEPFVATTELVNEPVEESCDTVFIEEQPVWHTVRRGETLQSIARLYGVEYSSVRKNVLSDNVAMGQRIRVK